VCSDVATPGQLFPARLVSTCCDRSDRHAFPTAAKNCEEKSLTRADNGAKSQKMNPPQEQSSLNRAASKRQIPISLNRLARTTATRRLVLYCGLIGLTVGEHNCFGRRLCADDNG